MCRYSAFLLYCVYSAYLVYGTKVQILTQALGDRARPEALRGLKLLLCAVAGFQVQARALPQLQFSCFTGRKVQILTPEVCSRWFPSPSTCPSATRSLLTSSKVLSSLRFSWCVYSASLALLPTKALLRLYSGAIKALLALLRLYYPSAHMTRRYADVC